VDIYDTPHKLGAAFTEFSGYQAIAKIPLPPMMPATAAPITPNPWAHGERGRPIRIETATGMTYATKRFTVKAGERISLTLINPDTMPHNIAILKPGTMAKVGDGVNHMAALPDGASKRYIPEGGDVLFYTDITDPGDSFSIHFNAPATPGEYPYICTFPGHWLIMNGVMVVE
jgi:azurin